ncbi:MAG: adventurous gliding motility protein CglE [Myxococcales bacterium]|nr:adventurous gliding motility protein CglE [Myxococcales bacterium]
MNGTRQGLALALLASFAASAQEAAAPLAKDKEAITFEEIERGFYFGVNAGGWFLGNLPMTAPSRQPNPFSPGQAAWVEVGMDIGDRLSAGVFLLGSANRAGAEYTGKSKGIASGDFSAIIPGVTVRGNLVGFNDSQEVRRTWVYVRGGAGYGMFTPQPLIPDGEVLIFAGPGVEYYTRLRHFSINIEVTGLFLLPDASWGFALTPGIRYAF